MLRRDHARPGSRHARTARRPRPSRTVGDRFSHGERLAEGKGNRRALAASGAASTGASAGAAAGLRSGPRKDAAGAGAMAPGGLGNDQPLAGGLGGEGHLQLMRAGHRRVRGWPGRSAGSPPAGTTASGRLGDLGGRSVLPALVDQADPQRRGGDGGFLGQGIADRCRTPTAPHGGLLQGRGLHPHALDHQAQAVRPAAPTQAIGLGSTSADRFTTMAMRNTDRQRPPAGPAPRPCRPRPPRMAAASPHLAGSFGLLGAGTPWAGPRPAWPAAARPGCRRRPPPPDRPRKDRRKPPAVERRGFGRLRRRGVRLDFGHRPSTDARRLAHFTEPAVRRRSWSSSTK